MISPDSESPDADILIASIFFLMSRYYVESKTEIASAIEMHFLLLEKHPSTKSTIIKKTCRRLSKQWNEIYKKNQFDSSSYLSDLHHVDQYHH